MHRRRVLAAMTALLVSFAGAALGQNMTQPFEDETVALTPTVRERLSELRNETKFTPHSFPPLGYAGPDTPEDGPQLVEIVDGALDVVLALEGDRVPASQIRPILHRAVDDADLFATEDRDRVWGYMLEVWYILGFRAALFSETPGGGYVVPEGYAEPLPPGWTAPDQPRAIGAAPRP